MKQFVTFQFFIVFSILVFNQAIAQKSTVNNPNIVIIFMDDLGYGDIEPFGAQPYKTPNSAGLPPRACVSLNFMQHRQYVQLRAAHCSPVAILQESAYMARLGPAAIWR